MHVPHPANLVTIKSWTGTRKGARGKFYSAIEQMAGPTRVERQVLVKLLKHCQENGGGDVHASMETLAEEASCSVRAVKYAIKLWRMARVLRLLPRQANHTGKSGWCVNFYELNKNPLSIPCEEFSTLRANMGANMSATLALILSANMGARIAHKDLTLPTEGFKEEPNGLKAVAKGHTPDERNDGASDEGRGDADEEMLLELRRCAAEECLRNGRSDDLGI